MNCPLQHDPGILLDYTSGRLSPAKKAALDIHMSGCVECAAFRFEQTAVWAALDEWTPSPVSMDFNRRLWQKIDAVDAAPWYRKLAAFFEMPSWKPVLPLAAAGLVIVAGFLLDHPADRVQQPSSARTVTTASTNEADQVEQTLDDIQLLHQFDAVANSPGS